MVYKSLSEVENKNAGTTDTLSRRANGRSVSGFTAAAASPAQGRSRKRDRRAAEQGAGRQHPRLRPGLRRLPRLRLPPGLRHGRLLGRPDRLHRRRRPPPRRRFRRHLLLLRQAAAPIVSPLLLRHQIQYHDLPAHRLQEAPPNDLHWCHCCPHCISSQTTVWGCQTRWIGFLTYLLKHSIVP